MDSTSTRSGVRTEIRLVAVDLDGTLLDSEWQLPEANRAALDRCNRLGIEVAIVTGRRYSAARTLTAKLDFAHHLVTNAGAMTSTRSERCIHSHPWEPGLLDCFCRHVGGFEGHMFFITESPGASEILCTRPDEGDPHVGRYLSLNAESITRIPSFDLGLDNVLQVAFMGTEAHMSALEMRIASFVDKDAVSTSATRYPERDFALVDAVRRNADKRRALEALARSLSIGPDAVMAIGDNYADVGMLEYAAYPVAMGNAPQKMRSQWPVTTTNDDAGVARAVESLILKNH